MLFIDKRTKKNTVLNTQFSHKYFKQAPNHLINHQLQFTSLQVQYNPFSSPKFTENSTYRLFILIFTFVILIQDSVKQIPLMEQVDGAWYVVYTYSYKTFLKPHFKNVELGYASSVSVTPESVSNTTDMNSSQF